MSNSGILSTPSGNGAYIKINEDNTVTYNDLPIGSLSFPSNKYNLLTIPATGTIITAPADGILAFLITFDNDRIDTRYIRLRNNTLGYNTFSTQTQASKGQLGCLLPVNKNDSIEIHYSFGNMSKSDSIEHNHLIFYYSNYYKQINN